MSLFTGDDLKVFAAANNEFAVGLYHELRGASGDLFFSPYNIRSALIPAYAGARGRTAARMAEALRLPESVPALLRACRDFESELASRAKAGAVEIDRAAALWRQKGLPLLPSYLELVRDALDSEVFEADFAAAPAEAARILNDWVEAKTRGMIRGIFSPKDFDRLTRLVLAAAIFFRGRWALPFSVLDTRPAPFSLDGSGETVDVPLMRREAEFKYAGLEGFRALEMAYVGQQLSMAVLLPDARDGLADLEKKLSAPELAKWSGALREQSVKVELPRFELAGSFRLEKALGGMGMSEAFEPRTADLSGMTTEKPLGIGSVLHQAKVEVDEQGTRAAAATESFLCLGLAEPRPPIFRADHPFLFMIRDFPTGAILFMGRVTRPEWTGPRRDAEAPRPGSFERPPTGSRRFLGRLLKALGFQ